MLWFKNDMKWHRELSEEREMTEKKYVLLITKHGLTDACEHEGKRMQHGSSNAHVYVYVDYMFSYGWWVHFEFYIFF